MSAKQTGPHTTVKGLRPWIAGSVAGLYLVVLGACAGPAWINPNKTAAEVRADDATCTQEAQQDSLTRAGRTRDYVAPPAAPMGAGQMGGSGLGQSPMDMRDRNALTRDFRGEYDRCMESKGYIRPEKTR